MQKTFTIDARTLIHLGRESIKDHTTALIELVKNSYDADANVVEIEIYNKNTQDKIRIADDGDGMSESDIDNKWLRIGFSHKRESKQTGAKERRKTGEKGIGRLSADRLGKNLEIRSRADGSGVNGLSINWELFNQEGEEISNIPIDVPEDPQIQLPAQARGKNGTELIITNLRSFWTSENIQNLYNELSILTPPFKDVEDFEIFLTNDIAPNFNGKVSPSPLLKPEIEIEIEYNGESYELEYTIKDRINPQLPIVDKISWQSLMQKVIDPFNYPFSDKLQCGPIKIRLLLYPRTKALVEGTKFSLSDLREFINKNVGIKIYRDNISVKPYGYLNVQYGGDWLGLAERHSRNPAGVDREDYRVVANQLVGAVFIERDKNPGLTDSAAREGLVENEAFYDLRAISLGALALLENRRFQIYQAQKGNNAVKPTPTERSEIFKNKIEVVKEEVKVIKSARNEVTETVEVRKAIENIEEFIRESEQTSASFEELLNHNRVLAGLATLGIAAAVFGHETQGAITEFNNAAILAREYLEADPEEMEIILDELTKAIKYGSQVSAWGAFSLSRVQKEKRKKQEKQINEIIANIFGELETVFRAVNIDVTLDLEDVKASVYPMDIESIIINIITNAYSACLQNVSGRRIKVNLAYEEVLGRKGFAISIANSGPPIDISLKEWFWEPLNTLKVDSAGKEIGTGLGLSIVKSIVEALKGINSIENNIELGGAEFKNWLPLK